MFKNELNSQFRARSDPVIRPDAVNTWTVYRARSAGISLDHFRSLLANATGRVKFYTPEACLV